MDEVKIYAPGTVANVGCGFDIMGFALENPGDILVIRKKAEPGITIINSTPDCPKLPLDPEKNVSGRAVRFMLEHLQSTQGFEIEFKQKVMPGSGIGSSAASSAGAVYGANLLLGEPLTRKELVQFAMEGERLASGSAHADNVAPALMGGFVLIRSYQPLDIIELSYPEELYYAVIHPQIEVRTEDARKICPTAIPLRDAITQWANTAGLVAGLAAKDYDLIGRSLQDVVIEPVRSILIPAFAEVKAAAIAAGCMGCSISGSGPSIFTLNKDIETAKRVAEAMKEEFAKLGIDSHTHVGKINKEGVRVFK